MKIKCSIVFVLLANFAFAQKDLNAKIDSSNYYKHFVFNNSSVKGGNLTTHWLNITEVVPIIVEELELGGFEWIYTYPLYKLNTGQNIVLSTYCRKSKFGYIFIDGHNVFPDKKDRVINNRYQTLLKVDYSQCEETSSGNPNFIKIKKLPSNIFILSEDCYWYQTTDNKEDDTILVTKEIATKILREDIRSYFHKVPR